LHFFTENERVDLYKDLIKLQTAGGILAISFKAVGDALQTRGKVVEVTAAGEIVEGDDQIKRLFASQPGPLAAEITGAGYELLGSLTWSVPNYNVEGEDGCFVGFVARKPALA
jgi:hypothetical protein